MSSVPITKRIILVAKARDGDLKAAVTRALATVAHKAPRQAESDLYDLITEHLRRNGIDYEDRYLDLNYIPAGKVYYHR
jgi:hypothetical protein